MIKPFLAFENSLKMVKEFVSIRFIFGKISCMRHEIALNMSSFSSYPKWFECVGREGEIAEKLL